MKIWVSSKEKIYESMDYKGEPFVEYCFTEEASSEDRPEWVKNDPNNYRTFSLEDL